MPVAQSRKKKKKKKDDISKYFSDLFRKHGLTSPKTVCMKCQNLFSEKKKKKKKKKKKIINLLSTEFALSVVKLNLKPFLNLILILSKGLFKPINANHC